MSKKVKCLVVDDEPVAREILESHLAKLESFELVASCKSALQAFQIISSKSIDLIFLDINMPEMSGLSFARSINKNIKVIFTTAYREYAVDGFDLQAVDYLLKPISFERFLQGIQKYMVENVPVSQVTETVSESDDSDFFFVRSDRKMVRIKFSEINFIESIADYVRIHFQDKNVVTRETISNIEVKLPQSDFLRIHRSYIVALKSIDSYTAEYVEIGKRQLPISRGYREQVMGRLGI
ncbi:LytTR family DNA-binding domain-containing protein [Maribellus sp. YY47]|uniref:LytR/AlgR family response regulator transcription factor n=1 Tax=Maribellus sp. YY47 TaxID=2929486 RepID=UPI0020009549|nr:LytTR family DNA-binding domain-containing protein [Maribellus sp. YY47]MCK3684041.1 LytTR family DNA-binding domain-containing protein [Maribellus sp. YY47]